MVQWTYSTLIACSKCSLFSYLLSYLLNSFVEDYRQVILGAEECYGCDSREVVDLRKRYSAARSVGFNLNVIQCQSQNDKLTNDEIGIISPCTLENYISDLPVHAENKNSHGMSTHSEGI